MATPMTDQEWYAVRWAEGIRQNWDPWDSQEKIERDGQNLRNREKGGGGGLNRRQATKTLQQLSDAGLERLSRATEESTDVVYFIQPVSGGPVKIGHTTKRSLTKRLESLQCAHPEELVVRDLLDGGAWLEAALHVLFSDQHLRGEWFAVSPYMQQLFGVI